VVRASSTSKQQRLAASIDDPAQGDMPERPSRWRAASELRWRSDAGQHMVFLSDWAGVEESDAQLSEQEEAASEDERNDEQAYAEAARVQRISRAEDFLPSMEMLKIVAERWMRVIDDAARQSLVVAFRVPGMVAPAELSRWLPGAAARLYTLGGVVAPLSDVALSKPPLANYSLVRAPNMSFWPHLRALIEEQERNAPGMQLWEDLESDLALLEQELAWWIASPQGLVLNLYEGEVLVGHLSLARQYDAAEGCDGWGIIALHVAQQARGQRLGMLLQRVAATLLVTRKATRNVEVPTDAEAPGDTSQTRQISAIDTHLWPYLFGFVAAHNIPALRGAYRAGRRIIGTYIDVPLEALYSSESAASPMDPADG
jgi:hypothetical protein